MTARTRRDPRLAAMSVTIVVPGCPDRILAPNRRAHGRAKAKATAIHRRDAWAAVVTQVMTRVPNEPMFIGPVAISAVIRWAKGERVHDLDSCAVMVKPMIDGLVDAGLMENDSQMKRLTISQESYQTSKTTGEVMLTLEEMQP